MAAISKRLHKFPAKQFCKMPELTVQTIDSPAPIGYRLQEKEMTAQIRQIALEDARAEREVSQFICGRD